MTHNSVLGSLESLWHYGRLPSPDSLQAMSSSCATSTCSPNFITHSAVLSSPIANYARSIASQACSLRSVFAVMDEDGDGRLSVDEMRSYLVKLRIISQANTPLESILTSILHQHTSCTQDMSSLDFPQFVQFYSALCGASQDCPIHDTGAHEDDDGDFDSELLDAFRVYDTNHDGFISAAELAAVLLQLGLLPADCGMDAHLGRCQAYIESVDLDGNGMVDLEEFKAMMMHNHPPTYGFGCSSSDLY